MSCVVHVENAPQERRVLFGMFGGKDPGMRIREAYHVLDPSCSTGISAIIEYKKMSSVSTAISIWDGHPQYTNGPLLKVQEVNLEFYCSILNKLHEKDIALQELQQEHDKLLKTLQAELPKGPKAKTQQVEPPKGPKAMVSRKPAGESSSSHDPSPRRPTLEQAPSLTIQSTRPIPVSSRQVDAETHSAPHGMDLPHPIAPIDLFPEMLAALEHVQGIVERGCKDTSHDVGQPSSRSEIKDVNRESVFLRRTDEQKIIALQGEEHRHKRRKTQEDVQTDMLHTYSDGRIGKRASSSTLPLSTDPHTRTRKLGHPIPIPTTKSHTPTPTPAHISHSCRKRLGGSLKEVSGIGTVSASETFLRGYIERQAKDKQQDVRRSTLGYHRSLA